MHHNQTWDLTTLSPRKQVVDYRWVYVVKFLLDGRVERLKTRLVTKGCTKTFGIDYFETSPVARFHSVRVLLSMAVV